MVTSPPIHFRIEWARGQGNVTAPWQRAHFNFPSIRTPARDLRSWPDTIGSSAFIHSSSRMQSKILFLAGLLFCLTPWASPPMALLVGLLFGAIASHPYPGESRQVSKYLLQAAVVGLGFGMNLQEVMRAGKQRVCIYRSGHRVRAHGGHADRPAAGGGAARHRSLFRPARRFAAAARLPRLGRSSARPKMRCRFRSAPSSC